MWVNSPANPTGRVLGPDGLRAMLAWCRALAPLLAVSAADRGDTETPHFAVLMDLAAD